MAGEKEIEQTLKLQVHNGEFNKIIKGEYPENYIITEKSLVDQYQCSKAPVREALIQLCSEGMLVCIPRCGYQLKPVTAQELEDEVETRLMLELGCFSRTFGTITPGQMKLLKDHVAVSSKLAAQHEVTDHWFRNVEFHLMLCSFARNNLAYRYLDQTLKFCSRAAYQYYKLNWDDNRATDASMHQQLIDDIESRNKKKAQDTLKQDILSFREIIR
jgi:DNA-binding GntR family transcriptional regulator